MLFETISLLPVLVWEYTDDFVISFGSGVADVAAERSARREKIESRPEKRRLKRILLIRSGKSLRRLDIAHRGLAGAAVDLGIEGDLLTLVETTNAGSFQSGGVHKHVLAAIVRLDKAEAFLFVVELHGTYHHLHISFRRYAMQLGSKHATTRHEAPVHRILERVGTCDQRIAKAERPDCPAKYR
jgi:hypothetical protein